MLSTSDDQLHSFDRVREIEWTSLQKYGQGYKLIENVYYKW